MNLKFRKIVIALTLSSSILGLGTLSASADKLVDYGIKVSKGVFNSEAFVWTGSDTVGYVRAAIEGTTYLWDDDEYDGWIQSPQISYKNQSVRGNHEAGNYKEPGDWTNAISYP